MNQSTPLNGAGLVALAILAGGCAGKMAAPRTVAEPTISSHNLPPQLDSARTAGVASSENAPGFVVNIDPVTGEILRGPPASALTPPNAAAAANTPAPEFFEVPSSVPGGGVKVKLQDQFLTPLVATIGADGDVTLKHETTMPADTAK